MKTLKLLAALAILELGGSGLWAAPIPTVPIHTNKTKFRIPFHYDAAELQRLGAREIRLYVSRDRGVTWKQVQAVAPDAGKFNFQAPADGEYWFIVRTLDSRNQLHPDGTVTDPGLQVIVDTTRPRLQLDLEQPAPGKVQLTWTASDEHVDITQLRLEYLQPGAPEWQAVSVVPKANGQTGWSVPHGGIVAVRGSIADLAKNTADNQAQIRISPANQAVPRPGSPERREPVAGPITGPKDNLALTMPDRFPSVRAGLGGDAQLADGTAINPRGETTEVAPAPSSEPLPVAITPKSSFVSMKSDERPPVVGGPSGNRAADTLPVTDLPSPSRTVSRPRVVNNRRFQIGYKLQDVGPSGIGSVELYITQDNGETWFHYGADDDRQSPIQVEVPREGTYGFTLGVRSGAGLESEPPHNGEPPAIVVVVDQTPPRLELLPVEQGRGKNLGKLFISWKCADENLAERPVSLFYSSSPQGPWQPIAGPLENTGAYVWTVPGGAPSKLHLRIEARDLAGNVETIDSPRPLMIDLSRPTAQIIDIESPDSHVSPRD